MNNKEYWNLFHIIFLFFFNNLFQYYIIFVSLVYIHFNLLYYFFLGLFCFLLNLLLVIVFSSSISKEYKLLRLFLCYLIFKFKFIFIFLSYTWNATKLYLSNKNNTRKIYYILLSILWKSLLKPHCFLIFFLFNFIFYILF